MHSHTTPTSLPKFKLIEEQFKNKEIEQERQKYEMILKIKQEKKKHISFEELKLQEETHQKILEEKMNQLKQ